MPTVNRIEWDKFINSQTGSHIMQTSQWGDLKSEFGWQTERIVNGQSGVQILFRKLPFGKSIAYIPKGPVGNNWYELLGEVDALSRKNQAIFLKIEPDVFEPLSPEYLFHLSHFGKRTGTIQPQRTIIVNLDGSEEDWLLRMKQKTRYNIHLAQRKDVTVHETNDVETFHQLMVITGKRDKFAVHNCAYFKKVHELFNSVGKCVLLEARYGDEVLGGLMVFSHQNRAWYLYGASNDRERNRMPNYLLQWEAMRWAGSQRCKFYDLWGIPDYDERVLEESFSNAAGELWGVYRFKRGFGGEIMRSTDAIDRIYHPLFYRLYLVYLRYFRNAIG
jgi:peptidoglycan pentaglycine glycine transferase (the first glycine)